MKIDRIINIVVSVSALMLSSCMTMDKNPDFNQDLGLRPGITGVVHSESGMPIEHIMVTLSWGSGFEDDVEYTSSEGIFHVAIPEEIAGTEWTIGLTLEDIDGIENGGEFEKITDQIILVPDDEEYTSGSISLDYHMTPATHEENIPQS